MRIATITAGAAGMYCGSCLHDNTLVATLQAQGHDALLIPTYTPIRTDEVDVSQKRVFFGGINVFLQQKIALFRHTPWFFDRLLDARPLLRWVARFALKTQAQQLGELAVSVLEGEQGRQRKEVIKLAHWLATHVRPEVVNLTNVLLSGIIPEIKRRVRAPCLCTLQGDDVFLEALPAPYRGRCLELIRDHCRDVDGFIATSGYYADFMAEYLDLPREKIHVVYPGLNLEGHGGSSGDLRSPLGAGQSTFTIGYFARICPEKGLHLLVEAWHLLRQVPGAPSCRLRVSGWLGASAHAYFAGIQEHIKDWGLAADFEYVDSPDHATKIRFLQSLDVLSVPTVYREPKGLYVLEALANGVPVVQPRHGSFPELIEATGGGILVNPNDPVDLARGLRQLLENPAHRAELGQKGKIALRERFHAARMAQETLEVYRRYTQEM